MTEGIDEGIQLLNEFLRSKQALSLYSCLCCRSYHCDKDKKAFQLVRSLLLRKFTNKTEGVVKEDLHLEYINHATETAARCAFELLGHNDVDPYVVFDKYRDILGHVDKRFIDKVHTEAKYQYELEDQMKYINEVRRDEQLILPEDLDYMSMKISTDARVKLAEARPQSIAAASRIPGMTPAAIVLLLRHVKNLQVKTT